MRVALSSPDRVLFPAVGFTKADLAGYYERVAPGLLPHIAGRPITLGRFPEGVERYGWYQTTCKGRPESMRTVRVGTQDYCVIDDLEGVLWAANMSAIELHPLLAPADDLERPVALVLDLDPGPGADLRDCCRVALAARRLLAEHGLEAFPKTSGATGLHVYAPLGGETFAEVKPFARELARRLAADDPRVTDRMPLADRAGKVFVDWNQNDRTKSLVAPYSLRAAYELPTVSTPVSWAEVEHADPQALVFSPEEVAARLEEAGDHFAGLAWRRGVPSKPSSTPGSNRAGTLGA